MTFLSKLVMAKIEEVTFKWCSRNFGQLPDYTRFARRLVLVKPTLAKPPFLHLLCW